MEIGSPPFVERFHIGISLTEFIKLTTIMGMGKMITPVANKIDIGTIAFNIIDPSATKSRVTIAASKLTSSVKGDFKRLKIEVFTGWGSVCMIQILI